MKLGIGSYTFTWAVGVSGYEPPGGGLTLNDLLEKADELGVEVVQICDNLPLHKLSHNKIKEASSKEEELGLEVEVGTRGIGADHLYQYLEIAEMFDSNIVRIIIEENGERVQLTEVRKKLEKVLPEFEKKGIKIAIENHDFYETGELIDLIYKLDSSCLGICLDTVNSFAALEPPNKVIKTLSPYTINLHIKDFVITRTNSQMGFSISGAPAGKGLLDIDYTLREIEKNENEVNAILELWTPYTNNIEETINKENEWAEESIQYLRRKI